MALDMLRHLKSIHPGHSTVEKNQPVRFSCFVGAHQFRHCLVAVLSGREQSTPTCERLGQNQSIRSIVIHDEGPQSLQIEGDLRADGP